MSFFFSDATGAIIGACNASGCEVSFKWTFLPGASCDRVELWRTSGASTFGDFQQISGAKGNVGELKIDLSYSTINQFILLPRTISSTGELLVRQTAVR
ncbi:hypothetical protein [Mesorhizobium sp. M7A.F.Ca.US.010.02.1.1]|uniref:hypothetical protein n=1 Tax=Mesorhizobium sp. M7A.F.Ca.US.010.02.1.1 TaxID=2496743 RepID=UPI000FD1B84E|nr:hypothetical protein [Mesorhizobium sp. M7A.F.Ca.US.010.02.1.1]RUW89614.1 hypothetical protein EOA19_23890 [Mesorhizobium sp. M7A.F.Ca.US.010.02.1.1]